MPSTLRGLEVRATRRSGSGLLEIRGALDHVSRIAVIMRFYAAPGMMIAALVLALVDGAAWRISIAAPLATLGVAWTIVDRRAHQRRGAPAASWAATTIGVSVAQILVVLIAGGLDAPVLPALVAAAGVAGVVDPRASLVVLPLQYVSVAVFAWLRATGVSLVPAVFGGHVVADADPRRTITVAVVIVFMGTLLNRLGARLRSAMDLGLRRARHAEDEMLRANAEHARGLVTLSAEIAHELKNPLASVKGLSALVSKDVTDKTAERVDVLRREVDRMQRILEEFLTFSRPLVPLALEDVDLEEVARDVIALHEGMLDERAIRVAVDAPIERLKIIGDPNKLRQALVNVLQNAIAASPTRGAVSLSISSTTGAGHEGALVRIRDEGPGLDPEVSARVFEPGVTTKANGNGLGLTIARSLARQHGGDVELVSRDAPTGGLEVRIWLPKQPAPIAAGEGA